MATSRRLFRQAASSSSSDTTRRLTVLLLKLIPHNSSVTAFTLRVLPPSTYTCINALTRAFSDRWYRSNNSVWNMDLPVLRVQQFQRASLRLELPRFEPVPVSTPFMRLHVR